MTDRQKKVLVDAFVMLQNGARRGKRLVEADAAPAEIASHIVALEALVAGMRDALDKAQGAADVLARVGRAKPLSSTRARS